MNPEKWGEAYCELQRSKDKIVEAQLCPRPVRYVLLQESGRRPELLRVRTGNETGEILKC